MEAGRAKDTESAGRFSRVVWVPETGSTNTDLLAVALSGGPEQVLVADAQTAGRGRLGRSWSAPAGASLLCSILVRPELAAADTGLLMMALGVAAVDSVAEVSGCELGLKWPNDLVTSAAGGDRKVSGMLSEGVLDGDRLIAAVLGIGINVNWPDELPDDLAGTATSLRHLAGRDVDRAELLRSLLSHFERRLELEPGELLAAYRSRSATLGRRVRIEESTGFSEAVALDVAADGALVVEDEVGDRRVLHAGDVVHLRPLG